MIKTNRRYKDRLFIALFGSPERKELTLELYNALNGTSYTNPDDIEINTLDDVIYIDMKNDISFILQDDLNMYEQQSTYNPNMPLKQFLYAAHAIEAYLEQNNLKEKLYGVNQVKIPTPKLVTLYNGDRKTGDTELRLSNCFYGTSSGDIEVVVHLYSINLGDDLLGRCKSIEDYSLFVETCKKNSGMINENAVNRAIAILPEGPVKAYLSAQRAEVIDMILTECNMENLKQVWKDDGRTEMVCRLVSDGSISVESGAKHLGISKEDLTADMIELGYKIP